MRHRILIIAAAVAGVTAAGFTVYWWQAAEALHSGVDAWAAARRAQGWRVNYGKVVVNGFPFRLNLVVADPRLASRHQGVVWRWRSSTLQASARPWRLSDIRVHVPAPNRIELRERGRGLLLNSSAAAGRAEFSPAGRLQTGWLRLADVDFMARDGATASRFVADSARIEAAAGQGVALRIEALTLPSHLSTPFGRRIARLAVGARITGPVDAAAQGTLPQILARWRDAGGTVEFDRIRVDWAPVSVTGGGSMALDARLQPAGQINTRFTGYREAIDLLARSGAVQPGDASTARLVLGLMARRPEGGGPAVVKAPLRIREGWLSVGPVRLVRLPPINWAGLCGLAAPGGCADPPR